jgi:hypothetical protein
MPDLAVKIGATVFVLLASIGISFVVLGIPTIGFRLLFCAGVEAVVALLIIVWM